MQINNFTIQVVNDYRMFYMLDKISGDNESIFLFKETPSGRVEHTLFQAYRMANNKVLIAFPFEIPRMTDYNYVAVCGEIEEIVNTQCYERIHNIYTKTPDNDKGIFAFTNSLPVVLDSQTNRCDMNNYGPSSFTKDGSSPKSAIVDASKLTIYEPLLSINGIGHIVYMYFPDATDLGETAINNFEIPTVARTFMEVLKVMTEWAEVYEPPFNNREPVVNKTIQFFETIGLDNDLVDHVKTNQVDMQVAQFLLGNPNARVRPNGVLPLTTEVENWLLSKLCFMTLSKLLEFYPDAWNAKEVLEKEKEIFTPRMIGCFSNYKMEYYTDSLDNIEYCVNTAVFNIGDESVRNFLTGYFEVLKCKRNLLNSI
jgi:hypothetical protein